MRWPFGGSSYLEIGVVEGANLKRALQRKRFIWKTEANQFLVTEWPSRRSGPTYSTTSRAGVLN
jgi:hypothetical protein